MLSVIDTHSVSWTFTQKTHFRPFLFKCCGNTNKATDQDVAPNLMDRDDTEGVASILIN